MTAPDRQTVVFTSGRGRVVTVDSAYDADERNRDRDVVISASYSGVLPARFVASHRPRAAIGMDCAMGLEGAGIAGLWFYEALEIPAAATAVMTAELGNGVDVYRSGRVSRLNQPARGCGVTEGMAVAAAARLLLERDPRPLQPSEVTNRTVMHTAPDGRQVVCTDSIAFGLPADAGRNVLVTAGHTGRSAVDYLLRFRPWGFICSDGGRGKNDSGTAGLGIVAHHGMAGATVDARTARMGDGLSTFHDGIISACNDPARRRGVAVGEPAREAALRLLAAHDEG